MRSRAGTDVGKCAPRLENRYRRQLSESVSAVVQAPNFHRGEINRLDSGKARIAVNSACFPPKTGFPGRKAFCESRESLDFFQSSK
jgi:hypothetical protein